MNGLVILATDFGLRPTPGWPSSGGGEVARGGRRYRRGRGPRTWATTCPGATPRRRLVPGRPPSAGRRGRSTWRSSIRGWEPRARRWPARPGSDLRGAGRAPGVPRRPERDLAEVVPWTGPSTAGVRGTGVSTTFHGRDVSRRRRPIWRPGRRWSRWASPAAAEVLGPGPEEGRGRIVWIDRSATPSATWPGTAPQGSRAEAAGRVVVAGHAVPGPLAAPMATRGGDVPFWYWGSGGTLEIAVRDGDAAALLGLRPGWISWCPDRRLNRRTEPRNPRMYVMTKGPDGDADDCRGAAAGPARWCCWRRSPAASAATDRFRLPRRGDGLPLPGRGAAHPVRGCRDRHAPAVTAQGQGHFFKITFPKDSAWEVPPAQVYAEALAQDLEQTNLFALVPLRGQAEYVLSADLLSWAASLGGRRGRSC